jgi:hypothetical protein
LEFWARAVEHSGNTQAAHSATTNVKAGPRLMFQL